MLISRHWEAIAEFNDGLSILWRKCCNGGMNLSEKDVPHLISNHSTCSGHAMSFKYAVGFLTMLKTNRNMKYG